MTNPAICMLRWKARARPPTCLSSTMVNQVSNPLSTGGETSRAVFESRGPCSAPDEIAGSAISGNLALGTGSSRSIRLTIGAYGGSLLTGDAVGGGISSTEESCKSWKRNEPRAT